MSVALDYEYLQLMIRNGAVRGSALEIGSRIWPGSSNARLICEAHQLSWSGCDIEPGEGVDFTLDVSSRDAVDNVSDRWDSLLVMNLLEHVFDPLSVLRNAMRLLRPRGSCLIVGPTVWQLHDYPHDFWRPMPDFFLEFSRREGHAIFDHSLHWLSLGRLIPIDDLKTGTQKTLPSKMDAPLLYGRFRAAWSRAVHFAAGTHGRDMYFPYVGLGAVLVKGPADEVN